MRAFLTILMSLLLAVLPAEGVSIAVEQADTCSSCRCCVQTNTNPAPVRSAPAAAKTVRAERQGRIEPQPFVFPAPPRVEVRRQISDSAQLRVPAVALFERHCSLLI